MLWCFKIQTYIKTSVFTPLMLKSPTNYLLYISLNESQWTCSIEFYSLYTSFFEGFDKPLWYICFPAILYVYQITICIFLRKNGIRNDMTVYRFREVGIRGKFPVLMTDCTLIQWVSEVNFNMSYRLDEKQIVNGVGTMYPDRNKGVFFFSPLSAMLVIQFILLWELILNRNLFNNMKHNVLWLKQIL